MPNEHLDLPIPPFMKLEAEVTRLQLKGARRTRAEDRTLIRLQAQLIEHQRKANTATRERRADLEDRLTNATDALLSALVDWADWLAAAGYPFDFTTDKRIPEYMEIPLAQAWCRIDGDTSTVDEMHAGILMEIGDAA